MSVATARAWATRGLKVLQVLEAGINLLLGLGLGVFVIVPTFLLCRLPLVGFDEVWIRLVVLVGLDSVLMSVLLRTTSCLYSVINIGKCRDMVPVPCLWQGLIVAARSAKNRCTVLCIGDIIHNRITKPTHDT